MKTFRTLLLLASCVIPLVSAAQWQWIDKDGKRVFSDRAPGGDIPAKDILKRPGSRVAPQAASAASAPAAAPAIAASAPASAPQVAGSAPRLPRSDKDLEARKKQDAEAEAAKRKAEEERIAKAKAENCLRARQSKATFDSGIRLARSNANGETEVMGEAARAEELKRIQSVMASDCQQQ